MRSLGWIAVAAAALPVLAVASHCALIESSGDVVVLETRDTEGTAHLTRLWFVEYQERSWIAAGGADAAWLDRIRRTPSVQVSLPGAEGAFRAVPVAEAREEILGRLRAKYGLADRWVRFMVGQEAIPVRLDPPVGDADPGGDEGT